MTGISRWMITTILAAVALLGGQSPCLAAAKLYIPNYDSGSVSAIDTGTNSVTATIGVGTLPMGVAVSHDGQRAYVAGNGSGSISVIDTLSDRVVTSFTVPGTVNGLALTPLGNRLYVTEKDGGIVRVIDTASGSIIAAVPGMSNPLALLAAADGTKVFASNQGNGAVTVISTADNSTHSISLGGTLGGMALTPDGTRLYVTKSSTNSVVVINTATNGVIWSIPVGNAPQHLAVSPDGGTLYVANTGTNTVSVINTATLTVSDTIPVGSSPDGLTLTPSGDRLYVINSASGTMSVFDTSAKTEIATVGVGSRPRAYGSFIASASSRVYVASTGGNGIVAHDPADSGNPAVQQVLSGAATTLDGPTGVAVFGNEIIVSNGNQDSIVIFRKQDNGAITPTRTISGALTNLSGPEQVVVDGHEIFVASAAVGSHLAVFNLSDSGNTAPKRELTTIDQVATVAVYGDELYLGRTGSSGDPDTLYVFDRSATGAASPLRTLTGSSTGLATIGGIAVYKNEIFVSNTTGNSITVYGRTDSGDTAPGRTISGGATLLNGPMGIIIIGDELFVANHRDNSILVFDRSGSGNVAPKRVIMGDRTGITAPRALAVESAWEPMIPTGPALYGSSFTYDEVHNKAIVYGGNDGGPGAASDVTWLWDGSAWSSKDTDNPPARFNAAMAYFAPVDKTLLFGGWEGTSTDTYRPDFWNFTGSSDNWTASGYSGAPPSARANAAVAYDSTRAEYLLFGGATPDLQNDTWTIDYSGGALLWVNRTTTGPTPRHFSRMAFDAARRVMVLFGGQSGFPGEFLRDTWEWNGSSWTRRAENGPDPRAAQAMAYDPARKRVVMYGGGGWGATEFQADTWEWTGSQWLRIDAGIPGEGDFGGMFYDKVQKRMILLQRDGSMWGSARMLDTRPPVVTSKVPAPSTVEVSRFATVSVSFNKEMDPSTLNNINFSLYDGTTPTSGTVSYDAASRTATFSPSAILNSGTTYTATLSTEIRDASGTPLSSTVTFTFTTVTEVNGTITGTVNWVASKSPYYVSANLTVNAGATLNIEAGTVVKFAQNVYINVSGILNAQGTAGSPVYFTDYRDDSVGGDSNGDGSTSSPSAGWWRGIRGIEGGVVNVDHGIIRYAAYASLGYGSYTAPFYKTGTGTVSLTNSTITESSGYSLLLQNTTATVTINNSTIENGSSHGIMMESAGSGVTVSNNIITAIAAGDGIRSNNSSPAITGNTVSGCAGYGLYVMGVALPSLVSANTFSTNTAGSVAAESNSSGVVIADDNSFAGPIYVVAGGSINRDVSWVNNRVYYVAVAFNVNAGQTLTIPAGRVVKFAQNTYVNVSGVLNAPGTTGSPVYFTDYRDDSVGGDSNGDASATSPSAGWWRGIRIPDGGSANLDHSILRYGWQGNMGYSTYAAPLYKTGTGTVSLTNSTITDTTGYSLHLQNTTATVTIHNSTIENGSSHGIMMESAGSGVTVSNNIITAIAAGDGIRSNNSSPAITGNTISGCAGYGLYVMGVALPSLVSGNTFNTNTAGSVAAESNSSGVVIADDNSFAGPIYVVAGGSITRDVSWVNNRVYYVAVAFNVNAGQTLTVPAGRVVKFAQNTYVNVSGVLNAQGTAGSPVYFTDYRDDSVGGDSNGDASATSPSAGWWYGIRIPDGGSANLDHSILRYGWQGNMGYSTYAAPLYKTGTGTVSLTNSTITDTTGYSLHLQNTTATVTIHNSTIQNGSNYGIMMESAGSGVTVSNNIITAIAAGDGIRSNNSSPAITGNTISGCAGYGLYVMGVALPSLVSGNTFNTNTAGSVAAESNSSGVVIADDNSFAGPIYVVAGGSITRDVSWVNNRVYYVAVAFNVNAGQTLSVPAGRVVKFAQNAYVNVIGVLNAQGTAGSPVYFTDYRDDSVGGDSNGDASASSPAAGWWRGIRIADGGSTTLDHSIISYGWQGNMGYSTYAAPLYKTGTGTVSLTNSTITDTAGSGVHLHSTTATVTINNNTIQNGSSHGILMESAGTASTVTGNVVADNGNCGLYINNSSSLIRENTIRNNTNNGIYLYGAATSPVITRNTIFGSTNGVRCAASANPLISGSSGNGNNIFGNSSYGVWNETTTLEVDASFNWWGSSTGPYHATKNAAGTGNAVSDYVYFGSFLASPDVPITYSAILPSEHYYGHVAVSTTTAGQVFTITNSGDQPMTFNSISLGGVNPGDFLITADTCSASSFPQGESCAVTVAFRPTAPGQRQAALEISSNDTVTPNTVAPLYGAGAAALPFRDDFTNAFSPYWAVLNQDADLYSLTTTAGSLAVSTTNTDFIGTESSVKNLFTVPIPTGINRFVVTAKILFPYRPSQNFQQGGIALLADKNGAPDLDSFIRASYVFDTGTRKFRVASEVNGVTSTSQVDAVQIDTATPIYLRISKNGTSFRCEYSTDGNTYTLIQDVTGSWDIDHAGFFAVNGAGVTATSIPVEYDWFLVEGDPVADVTPASANYGAVQVGHSSPPQAFTVGNSGLGDLVVNGINPTGSDAAMFSVETGSCGTLPATIAPGDSCNFSVTFTPTSVGDHSAQVIVSTNDPATPDTSIGLTGGGTAFRNLTLAFSGTGTGSVVSDPPGIACNEGCSASFLQGTEITLTMIPNEYMVFNGWVGPCSGTGTCIMTLTGDTIVTAAIDRDTTHTCRIAGVDPVYYSLLQDAFNATGDGSIVEAWAIQFSTLPALYLPGTVTLRGGFNQDYSNNPEMTPLSGPLTIGSGALIIDRIVIQ